MAELLRRQSSIYESNHPNCMWGLLQFFDFHRRLHRRKMLAYRRHGDGRHAGRAKIQKSKLSASSIVEEHDSSDSKANLLMEDNTNTTKRSSGKARMKTLISKLYKKQDRKQKISPSASQMLRTISIHHLECNDYVIPDEMTSDSETSTAELNSHESDSSASNVHVSLFPRDPDEPISGLCFPPDYVGHNQLDEQKLNKATDSLLKQMGADAKKLGRDVALQSKDFMDMSELFNANKEMFLRILEDPNSILENYIQPRHDSSPKMVLRKSGSFPGAGFSGRRNGELSKLKGKGGYSIVNPEEKSQAASSPSVPNTIKDDSQAAASIAGVTLDILKPKPGSLDSAETCSSFEFSPSSSHKLKNQRDRGTVLTPFKVIKQRIKDVIRDNRKERHRISMDGFLDKIPYGRKVPEDVEKEKLRLCTGSTSDRYDRDSLRCKLGDDGSVSANSKYKHIQRSHSLTESLDRYSRLLESISVREAKRPPERLKAIHEQERKTPKTWGRILSNPEFGLYAFSKDVPSELSDAPLSSKIPASGLQVSDAAVDTYGSDSPKSASTLVHTEDNMESDKYVGHTVKDIELQYEREQIEPCKVSDDLSAGESSDISLHEKESRIEVESCDKTTRPSTSVLESNFQEDPVSPMKYSLSEGSELIPGWITFEELESGANDVSKEVELITADFDNVQMPIDFTDFNARRVQVDPKDEAEFNYVRDILKKSGFDDEDFLESWYSPIQLVDPSLIREVDGSHHELNIARDEADDISVDHQILFDLINEVLLDIYESSHSRSPGLSRFASLFRQNSIGNHVLEEVWTKISWHLNFQPHLNPTFDHIVARDFVKNDGWMNLQWDTECVGVEMECLILDDLLDEVILGALSSIKCVAS